MPKLVKIQLAKLVPKILPSYKKLGGGCFGLSIVALTGYTWLCAQLSNVFWQAREPYY